MSERQFDLVVIGTGSAGHTAALKCRERGWRVAIVDQREYGGTCALRGCDPKKVLVAAARVFDDVARRRRIEAAAHRVLARIGQRLDKRAAVRVLVDRRDGRVGEVCVAALVDARALYFVPPFRRCGKLSKKIARRMVECVDGPGKAGTAEHVGHEQGFGVRAAVWLDRMRIRDRVDVGLHVARSPLVRCHRGAMHKQEPLRRSAIGCL
jgi:hypothetical protein